MIAISFIVSGCNINVTTDKESLESKKEDTVEKTEDVIENTENSYKIFADKLKNEIANFDETHYSYKHVDSVCVSDGYSVKLTKEGSLLLTYYNFSKKLSIPIEDYKVADNVLSFYVINTGQDSCHILYYISEDGTVSQVNTENNVTKQEDITVTNNIDNLKNIVTITEGIENANTSGSVGPIFIDINGNMYN